MYETVLIATDGSRGTLRASKLGLDVASATGAAVHALYVVDERERRSAERVLAEQAPPEEVTATSTSVGRRATDQLVGAATARGLDAIPEIRSGVPAREIRSYSGEVDADLLVVGTHGAARASQPLVGSTAERVVATADVPVLVVRAGEGAVDLAGTPDRFETVLVATDGSDAAERSAAHALALADHYGAAVHALYVVDESIWDLEDAPRSVVGLLKEGGRAAAESVATLAAEEDHDVTVEPVVRRGVPREVVRSYGDEVGADLLVLGTRGLGGGDDPVVGSTTRRVVRQTSRPVLTIR